MNQYISANLNGWQRLWVVACGLWLIATVAWIVLTFPTEEESHAYMRANTASRLQSFDNRMKVITDHCAKFASTAGEVMDIVKYTNCRSVNKPDYERAESQRNEEVVEMFRETENYITEELPKQQVLAVLKGLGIWIIPCLFAYLLGLGIAWIRRGFGRR